MLVPQRDIVQRTTRQRVVHCAQPNQRGLARSGVERVDPAVRHEDPGHPIRRQAVENAGDKVDGGRFRPPRRGDDLQPRPYLVHTGPIEHPDIRRLLGDEQRTGVDRRRVQRVVVAGQQVDRDTDGAHGLQ
jgi:hypothetical protein